MFYRRYLLLANSERLDILSEVELWSGIILSWPTGGLITRLGEVVGSTWGLAHINLWDLGLRECLSSLW